MNDGALTLTPPASKRLQVLCYGHDKGLLRTRSWILQQCGWVTSSTTHLTAFQQTLEQERPEVAVLCQTLTPAELEMALHSAVARRPVTQSIVMYFDPTLYLMDSQAQTFNCAQGPAAFAEIVSTLITGSSRQKMAAGTATIPLHEKTY